MAHIKRLEIRNFKSIRHLTLNCNRINVFIGEPNVGKSNILESLGLLSYMAYGGNLNDYVRHKSCLDLFYNKDFRKSIVIRINDESITGNMEGSALIFRNDKSIMSYNRGGGITRTPVDSLKYIKFYRHQPLTSFSWIPSESPLPPRGENMPAVLYYNEDLRKILGSILEKYDLKLVISLDDNKIYLQREITEGIVISLPYSTLSDTLQRLILYFAAIEGNEDSVIVFEEPEAHAFPYFTKFLAERIAMDGKNQYFISTHNPYFLLSVVEKAKMDEITVFITYMENSETRVAPISGETLSNILDYDVDVFFNLDELIELSTRE